LDQHLTRVAPGASISRLILNNTPMTPDRRPYLTPLLQAAAVAIVAVLLAGPAQSADTAALLDAAINGTHRSDSNRARDTYRHPKETLLFFGLKPDITVVEISPSAGWYSEIIAPVLRDRGSYYAASPKLSERSPESMKQRDASYRQMMSGKPSLYGTPIMISYEPSAPEFAPKGSADLVLTFRNVHNWAKAGNTAQMFSAFFDALKKGGVLGVVEHRAAPDTPISGQIASGYMTEAFVIDAATEAGFRLVAFSDVNNNPRDTKDHPGGVWNLPPNLRDVPEQDRARYLAIGESDRMTLKFVKP